MKTKRITDSRLALCGFAIAATLLLGGCQTRVVDYTLLSTKNVDLSQAGRFQRGANRVTGEDKMMWILFIPTAGSPNMKEAVDRAVEGVPGAVALVDGVVSYRGWWFIVGESAYMVEGTPLIDPSAPGASASLTHQHMVSFYNPRLQRQEAKPVDRETHERIRQLARAHEDKALSELLLSLE